MLGEHCQLNYISAQEVGTGGSGVQSIFGYIVSSGTVQVCVLPVPNEQKQNDIRIPFSFFNSSSGPSHVRVSCAATLCHSSLV